MNWHLVYNLFFAHIVADFYCQSEESCKNKKNSGFKGWHLYKHSLVVLLLTATACWNVKMFFPAAIIGISHLILDGIKSLIERKIADHNNALAESNEKKTYGLLIFIVDQLLHIAIIMFCAWYFGKEWSQFPFLTDINPRILMGVLALIVLAKPVNILVDVLFTEYTISPVKDKEKANDTSTPNGVPNSNSLELNNFHSGRIIGTLERWLILLLVMLTQYEAIGFLIAAKSILRFSETSKGTEKSEYVLVGTLFSFLIALSTGILILKIV